MEFVSGSRGKEVMFNLIVEAHVDEIVEPVTGDVAGSNDLVFHK